MKTRKLLLTILIGIFLLGELQAQLREDSISSSLLMELQTKTQKWKEAYNSGDARNLQRFYTQHSRYVSGHVAGLELIGRDNVLANFQKGISGGGHIDSIEIISSEKSCDLVTLLTKYQATNNGQTVTGRNLLVLKKMNGDWLIVLHVSVV